jgi:hypothetical protein
VKNGDFAKVLFDGTNRYTGHWQIPRKTPQ